MSSARGRRTLCCTQIRPVAVLTELPSAPAPSAGYAYRAFCGQNDVVPLVDVTYSDDVSDDELRRLARLLPDLIAEAVDCPEEPWAGPAGVGDIEIRFRPRGEFDVGELRFVLEVQTKLVASRLDDKQRRADLIRDGLSALGLGAVGVWLILHDGAWSQT